MVAGVLKEQLKDFAGMFRQGLRDLLVAEQLGARYIDIVDSEYDDVHTAPTSDRSVIASMNDIAFHYRWMINEWGGLSVANVVTVAQHCNRRPILSRKNAYAIELLNDVLRPLGPPLVPSAEGTNMLDELKRRLGDDRGTDIVLTYEEVVPPFASLPLFMAFCARADLECFFPPITTPGAHPIRIHVRHRTLFTVLGLDLPPRS